MITFKQITAADYEIVKRLDNASFKKGTLFRSAENIANLALVDPEGCLLCLDGGKPVGFIFCRTHGSIGYIGPLGIDPNVQNKGYGKLTVAAGIDYLQKRKCEVIGLETMPEWGKNIGLYHKQGFRVTLPGRVMEKIMPIPGTDPKLPEQMRLGSNFSKDKIKTVLAVVKNWTGAIYPGCDFSRDLQHFIEHYPERILFVFDNKSQEVAGFLAFHPEFNRYAWGAVKPGGSDRELLLKLLNTVEELNWSPKLTFRFQTRFTRVTDALMECGYQLHSDTTCMVHQNHSGQYNSTSEALLLRPWVG
ncbi:MAG: GNAT family N-acetyltransferase [Bacillota bacterium]